MFIILLGYQRENIRQRCCRRTWTFHDSAKSPLDKLFNIKIKLWSPSQCAQQWHWCWWWLCCIGRQRWKLSIQADMFLKKIFSTRICVLLVVKNHIRSPNLLKRKTDIPHSPKIWTRKWFYGAFGKPVYFIKFYMAIKFWNLK